jgi:hypothetical protein
VSLQVTTGRLEVVERGLGREAQLHKTARRVVDVDQQRASRPALLEPRVVRTVDLDQLADARAAAAWLLGALATFASRPPQAVLPHPCAQGLDREHQAVLLDQLLVRERRPEVRVYGANDAQRRRP